MARSLQQNEEFISFRSFTEYYITERPECANRFRPTYAKGPRGPPAGSLKT